MGAESRKLSHEQADEKYRQNRMGNVAANRHIIQYLSGTNLLPLQGGLVTASALVRSLGSLIFSRGTFLEGIKDRKCECS